MVHDIQWPGPKIATTSDGSGLVIPADPTREILARKFGQNVDVVLFGDTHHELICAFDGVLLVNPGSPTYPARRRTGVMGTLGILDIHKGSPTARLVELHRDNLPG